METVASNHSEDTKKRTNSSTSIKKSPAASSETAKPASKPSKPSVVIPNARIQGTVPAAKRRTEANAASDLNSTKPKSTLMKPTLRSSIATSVQRRNSTGGLSEKRAIRRPENGAAVDGKKGSPAVSDPGKRNTTESRRSSLPSISPKTPVPQLSARSLSSKSGSTQKSSARSSTSSAPLVTFSSTKVPSSVLDRSNGRSSLRRVPSSVSSPRTPSGTSSFKSGSLSASIDKGSSLSVRRKSSTPDSREARFMMLPQVDIKAGDDLVSAEDLVKLRVGIYLETNSFFV